MEQSLVRKVLQIDGMTCTSCEMRIENVLCKFEGVVEAKAIFSSSNAYVTYDSNLIELDRIIEAIEKLDYKVKNKPCSSVESGIKNRKASTEKMPVNQLLGIGIIIFALYIIIKNTVGFNFIPQVNQTMGYGLLFVVGLLTSLHCIAMCGGINLSQCVSYKYDNDASGRFAKLKPSFLYNSGRVISYTIIGGLVGALGKAVSFSGGAKGVVAIVSGVFMVIMGINMLNIFPWLRKFNPRMPKIFGNKIHNNNGKRGPFYIGLLNGLMPCGPLQAMQLYALGTGSFIAGATSMFLFSLGTVPLMFGFGAISSLLSSKFTHKMMKVSAVLVLILGIVMVDRGLNLSGVNLKAYASIGGSGNIAQIQGDVQEVTTKLESGRYSPIVVQKGIPVKWNIKVEKGDLNGCNNPITIPQYEIQRKLEIGDNIIEFTPDSEGNVLYTCWMGMISSNIKVVSDLSTVTDKDVQDAANGASSSEVSIPTGEIVVAEIKDNVQYINMDVYDDRLSPSVIVLERGMETKWVINVKELKSHNKGLILPEYNGQISLKEGENKIEFVPEIDFSLQCLTGTLNGYVKVVDDINNINIDDIKKEVENYQPPSFGGGAGGGMSCH